MQIKLFGKNLFEAKSGKAEHYIQLANNQIRESKYLPDFKTIGHGGSYSNVISDFVFTGSGTGTLAIPIKKDFKKTTSRRDPILLAQSPFGHFWQILGAWDKEMLFLEEL